MRRCQWPKIEVISICNYSLTQTATKPMISCLWAKWTHPSWTPSGPNTRSNPALNLGEIWHNPMTWPGWLNSKAPAWPPFVISLSFRCGFLQKNKAITTIRGAETKILRETINPSLWYVIKYSIIYTSNHIHLWICIYVLNCPEYKKLWKKNPR